MNRVLKILIRLRAGQCGTQAPGWSLPGMLLWVGLFVTSCTGTSVHMDHGRSDRIPDSARIAASGGSMPAGVWGRDSLGNAVLLIVGDSIYYVDAGRWYRTELSGDSVLLRSGEEVLKYRFIMPHRDTLRLFFQEGDGIGVTYGRQY